MFRNYFFVDLFKEAHQTNNPGYTFLAKDGVRLNETGKKRLAMPLASPSDEHNVLVKKQLDP
uniref:Uncharacterized protein n=1 Tax=Romanomermis culicivorax TaxID=13658 RepID=A0A915KHQ3_ROMCU